MSAILYNGKDPESDVSHIMVPDAVSLVLDIKAEEFRSFQLQDDK